MSENLTRKSNSRALLVLLMIVLVVGGGYLAYAAFQTNAAQQQNLCQASTLAGAPRGC